jgi:Ras-related protein Rab-43
MFFFFQSFSMAFEPDEKFDFLFKIVLIGDAGIGKTCIVQRFKSGNYVERQGSTIGVDFTMKTLVIDKKRIKVRTWTLFSSILSCYRLSM